MVTKKARAIDYLYILPAIIFILVFAIYPTIFGINISLRTWILYYPQLGTPFVGLKNYIDMFLNPSFQFALQTTLEYVIVSVIFTFMIGFAEAYLLDKVSFRGKEFVTTLLILPLSITPVVVGFSWRFMFKEDFGLITAWFLPSLGMKVPTILGSPTLSFWGVLIAEIWSQSPLVFLILTAGFTSLPQAPYEAAMLDGASAWQTLRSITLPLLRPVILIAIILRTIDAFKVFDTIWIMTNGGPGISTTTLNVLGYETAFESYNMGQASALGLIMLYITLALTIVFVRVIGRKSK
jgi:multiple sugar transport system permease protein